MEEKIEITIRVFGVTHTVKLPEDVTAVEFIEKCALLTESFGYSPDLIREGLLIARERRM